MHGNQLKQIAIVGATGLVGSRLLALLLADVTVHKVVVLSRRDPELTHPKLEVIITDFKNLENCVARVQHFDTLFCCIGTTIRAAGSKEHFKEVDYHIPMRLAALAVAAGIQKFIAISSLGALAASKNFYLRTKGEMERDIASRFRFQKLAFLRPSLLLGERKEFRLGERVGQLLMVVFSFALRGQLARYKPIHDYTVAKAMLSISNSVNNQRVYESDELEWLGH